ncbi:MAG: DUF393 domain-containing protein [Deinococcales bacterium]
MDTQPTPQKPYQAKATVLYDGNCVFCRRQVAFLDRLSRQRLNLLNLHEHWRDYPQVSFEAAMQEMKLIDEKGKVYGGAGAVAKSLEIAYPLLKLSKLYNLPGVKWFCDMAYRLIAENRYRLMGEAECEGACGLKYR